MNLFVKSDLYLTLCSLYSHNRIMENIEMLRELEKPRQYYAFQNSTSWCTKILEEAGFSDVRRISHKADGETASYRRSHLAYIEWE